MAEEKIFPVHTLVAPQPVTLLKSLHADVFGYPFFNEGADHWCRTVRQQRSYDWDDINISKEDDLLQIKGFIFHTAHCGSTLLARMLGSLPGVRVISETEAINGLLLSYLFFDLPEGEVMMQLKRIIEAYRQPLKGEQTLIFKLTSWNVFFIRWFQQLYPAVSWLYIDRDTDEVVRSLLDHGDGFTTWWHHPVDTLRKKFLGKDFACSNKEDFLRQMVHQHRYHAERNSNTQGCMLKYPAFINAFESAVLPHLSLQFTKDEMQPAYTLLQYDAKRMKKEFFTGAGENT